MQKVQWGKLAVLTALVLPDWQHPWLAGCECVSSRAPPPPLHTLQAVVGQIYEPLALINFSTVLYNFKGLLCSKSSHFLDGAIWFKVNNWITWVLPSSNNFKLFNVNHAPEGESTNEVMLSLWWGKKHILISPTYCKVINTWKERLGKKINLSPGLSNHPQYLSVEGNPGLSFEISVVCLMWETSEISFVIARNRRNGLC